MTREWQPVPPSQPAPQPSAHALMPTAATTTVTGTPNHSASPSEISLTGGGTVNPLHPPSHCSRCLNRREECASASERSTHGYATPVDAMVYAVVAAAGCGSRAATPPTTSQSHPPHSEMATAGSSSKNHRSCAAQNSTSARQAKERPGRLTRFGVPRGAPAASETAAAPRRLARPAGPTAGRRSARRWRTRRPAGRGPPPPRQQLRCPPAGRRRMRTRPPESPQMMAARPGCRWWAARWPRRPGRLRWAKPSESETIRASLILCDTVESEALNRIRCTESEAPRATYRRWPGGARRSLRLAVPSAAVVNNRVSTNCHDEDEDYADQ